MPPSPGPDQEHREGADLPHLQGALHPPADPALPAQRLPQVCQGAADAEPRGLFRCRLRVLPAGQPQVQGALPLHGEARQACEIRWVSG